MIVDYLEKIHQEVYEKKLRLERKLQKNIILFKNNDRFVRELEDSLDENFESFSPRKVDQKSHKKIESLLEEQQEIENASNQLKLEIANLNAQLAELEGVLKIARENVKSSLQQESQKEDNVVHKRKMLEIQELERQRIAKDLQDCMMQNLSNIVHKIEICTKIMDVDTIRCRLELQAMSKNIKEIIRDMRKIIFRLDPIPLEDINLDIVIERELSKVRKNGRIKVSYKNIGEKRNLSPIVLLMIYYAVQESCSNIIKHSNAKNVNVQTKYTKDKVQVIVEDDGIGFELKKIEHMNEEENSKIGIFLMQERIYLLSGKLEVNSEVGKGTKIVLEVPIDKEDTR